MKISKELIRNVLVKETENLSDDFTFNIEDNYILFVDEGESQFEVNLDTFLARCKDLAFEDGFPISTCKCSRGYYFSIHKDEYFGSRQFDGIRNCELEAVLTAIDWIGVNKL